MQLQPIKSMNAAGTASKVRGFDGSITAGISNRERVIGELQLWKLGWNIPSVRLDSTKPSRVF